MILTIDKAIENLEEINMIAKTKHMMRSMDDELEKGELEVYKERFEAVKMGIEALEKKDNVKIIRCKDCKDYDSWSHTCVHWTYHCTPAGYSWKVDDDEYCAWGERRE